MHIVINDEPERWAKLQYNDILPIYEISTYGKIRYCDNKMLKNILTYDYSKYECVSLRTVNGNKRFDVHVLVAYTFIEYLGDASVRYIVNHKDSITTHNYYKNLEWITYWDNTRHGILHGNITGTAVDEDGNKIIYTEDFIMSILEYVENGLTSKEICYKLEIPKESHSNIKALIKDLKCKRTHRDLSNKFNIPDTRRNLFPIELVHNICMLLRDGVSDDDIIHKLKSENISEKLLRRKLYGIKHKTEFVKISDMYNLPKSENILSSYSDELIRDICILLQNGLTSKEIIIKLQLPNVNKTRKLISDIYNRRSRKNVSKYYKW